MRAKALKWGNSLAVRLPKAIAEQVNVHEHDLLEIETDGQIIRIRRFEPTVDLDALVSGITPENLHREEDFGVAEGHEIW